MVNSTGTAGNDYFVATAENDFFDGGTGYDVVQEFAVGRRGATVTVGAGGDVTLTAAGQADTFRSIEQIDFADGRLVFGLNLPAVQVVRLYNAALARSADQGGLNSYIYQLEGGTPLSALANNFLASPEFEARFGANLSNEQYINQLYTNVLVRNASASETQYYLDLFAQGVTRQQVLVNFSESPENQNRTLGLVQTGVWDYNENAVAVARLYDTTFNRPPDVAGLSYYRSLIDLGQNTLGGIVDGFIGSPEFRNIYGGAVTSTDFTVLLYRNTLGREPGQAEVDYYASRLDSGQLTRAQTVLGFSESPEHQALLLNDTTSEIPSQFGILFV